MAISDCHLIHAKHLRGICLTSQWVGLSNAIAVVHNHGAVERERAPAFGGVLCTDAIWEGWP